MNEKETTMEQIKIKCYVSRAVAIAAGKSTFGGVEWKVSEDDLSGMTDRQREYLIDHIARDMVLKLEEFPSDWSVILRALNREIAVEDAEVDKVLEMAPHFWVLEYDTNCKLRPEVSLVRHVARVRRALEACAPARLAVEAQARANQDASNAKTEERNRIEREAAMRRIEEQRQKEAAEERAAEEAKTDMIQWCKESDGTIEHGLSQGYPMTSAMCEAVDAHVTALVQRELPEAIVIDEDQARWADLEWETRNSPNQASFDALAKFERVLKQVQVDLPFVGDVSSTAFVVRCTEDGRHFTALVAEYVLPLSPKRRVILVDLE